MVTRWWTRRAAFTGRDRHRYRDAGIDGIAAAALIRHHDPNARIVFVTVHAEPMFVEAGLEAGALGYVLKDSAGDELVAAIHAALSGRQYVSRELRASENETEN